MFHGGLRKEMMGGEQRVDLANGLCVQAVPNAHPPITMQIAPSLPDRKRLKNRFFLAGSYRAIFAAWMDGNSQTYNALD